MKTTCVARVAANPNFTQKWIVSIAPLVAPNARMIPLVKYVKKTILYRLTEAANGNVQEEKPLGILTPNNVNL